MMYKCSLNKILIHLSQYFISNSNMLHRFLSFSTVLSCLVFMLTACDRSIELPTVKSEIAPDSLVIAKLYYNLYGLKATSDGKELDSTEVTWSSNNPRIASVDSRGYVTPMGAGHTEIVATLVHGKGLATCKVTVYDNNDYKYRLILKDYLAMTLCQ